MKSMTRQTGNWGAAGRPWAALLGLLLTISLGLAGCGSGDLVAPDEILASWDSIEYVSTALSGALHIDQTGAVRFADTGEGADSGFLGVDTWRTLESALARAEMGPVSSSTSGEAGIVRLTERGEARGFAWDSQEDLSTHQKDLVGLLEHVRNEGLNPEYRPKLDPVATTRLLHGVDAQGEPRAETLINDEEALISFIRAHLDREVVVFPEVNFAQESIVVVYAGLRSAANYDVEIADFITPRVGDYVEIEVTRYPLAEGCPLPQSEGGAFDIVRLPKLRGEVFFHWREGLPRGCMGR